MAMTPSQLSIVVESKGIAQATAELEKLAKAGASVDKETKTLAISQAKLANENAKTAVTSAKLQTEMARQDQIAAKTALTLQMAAQQQANAAMAQIDRNNRIADAAEKAAARQEQAAQRELAMAEAKIQAYGRMQSKAEEMNRKRDEESKKMSEVSSKGNVYVNTLRSMATAASAYLGVNFLSNMVKEADAWGMMQSKLKLAIGDMTVAKNVQQDLFDMSQRLRVPLEDTAKLFTRMSVPLQRMGVGIKDTEKVVGAFSTALKLAGATGQEASSAMLQFSQSINAGRLNGGEFNSIAEASPNILRAIEAELIRTGRAAELSSKGLKKMASDGKLTTDVLVSALKNAAPQWQKDFESLPITVDGALTRIKNAWNKAIGELGQNTKFNEEIAKSLKKVEDILPVVAEAFANAFLFIVNNGDKILAFFTGLAGALAVLKLVDLVEKMSLAYVAINNVTKAAGGLAAAFSVIGITPVGLALTALGAVIGGGIYLWNKHTEEVKKAAEQKQAVARVIPETIKNIDNETKAIEAQISKLNEELGIREKLNTQRGIEGISEMSKAMTSLTELELRFEKSKQAWEKVKGDKRISDSGLFREMKDDEENLLNARKAFNELSMKQNALAAAQQSLLEKQRMKDMRDRVESIYNAARTEQQILKDQYNEKVNKAKLTAKELKLDDLYLKQDLLNIQKWYNKELEKITDAKPKAKASDLFDGQVELYKEIMDLRAKAAEKEVQDTQKRVDAQYEQNAAMKSNLETLYRQLEAEESIKTSKAEQNVIEAERNIIKLNSEGIMGIEIAMANERLRLAKETLNVEKSLEQKKEFQQQAEKYENAYQAANKKIQDGLYAAIGKGGGNAIKKLIEDIKSWFARLVLSPIINPISQFGASIIAPNAASAAGGADILGNLATAGKSLWDGFVGAGNVAGSTGFMASLAGGLNGAGVGSGLTSSLGLSIGNSISSVLGTSVSGALSSVVSGLTTIAPYLAAVAVLYKGLSMGEKQMTGQTVTGNLGTDNLSRNVSWMQQGGFLRKDRSGTWSYGLKDSTAIQDGKAYQDTASVSSDRALLEQLNSMYSAVKLSTSDLAKSMGLNAEEIMKRNDAINFSFGKDAQETTNNISKAFESIANAMSKDLLGGLISLAKVGESEYQTLTRLSTTINSVNGIFSVLGYKLYDVSEAGIKSADALVTLYGGLDKFQAITQAYYDNFYSDSEKTEKALAAVKKAIKDLGITEDLSTREAFRARVDKARADGDEALAKSLMQLSGAFAQVVAWTDKTTDSLMNYVGEIADMPSLDSTLNSVVDGIKKLASEAERWYNIRNQAQSMQSSIDDILGNPKKDPTIRMRQLWDAMAKDVSPEQKIALAGELKDLVLSKYQVEKDSMQKLIDFGKQLRGYVDSLKLGSLSPMTMTEKLIEAKKQYEDTLTKAMAGDSTAQSALQGKSDSYLQLAQTALASSDEYANIFNNVTNSLDALGIDSMSAADKSNVIAENQLQELQKLKDYLSKIELSSDTYYNSTLTALYDQTKIANDLYARLGNLEGLKPTLDSLPAEIAAALRGKANEEFVTGLYSSIANKSGSAIDSAGMNYWMQEVDKFGTDYVQKAFKDAVNNMAAQTPMAPTPMMNSQVADVVAALREEIQSLKESSEKNTLILAETIIESNTDNANKIVDGTNQNNAQASWTQSTMPELV